jgi:hypothetical protein
MHPAQQAPAQMLLVAAGLSELLELFLHSIPPRTVRRLPVLAGMTAHLLCRRQAASCKCCHCCRATSSPKYSLGLTLLTGLARTRCLVGTIG